MCALMDYKTRLWLGLSKDKKTNRYIFALVPFERRYLATDETIAKSIKAEAESALGNGTSFAIKSSLPPRRRFASKRR